MKRVLTLCGVLACAGLSASNANAAGYAFWEQSAAATGRAGAVVASPTDASAGFYNPAGLTNLESGLNLYFGGTFVLPLGGYESSLGTFDRTIRGVFPPNLHVHYVSKGSWSVGLSFFNAFGLGIDWNPEFPGSDRIDRVDLKTPTFQPTFSWRPNKQFSLGVGISIVAASAELERSVPIAPFPAGSVFLGASGAIGIGGNIGFLYSPTDSFRIGFHYRSATKLSFSGKAHFQFSDNIPASVRATLPSDQSGSLDITTPHVISLGLAYDINKDVTVEFNFLQYIWSVFDELRLRFGPPTAGNPVPGNCTPTSAQQGEQHVCSPRAWMDVPQFRLGVEWRATKEFTLRGGYIFDLTPVPSGTIDPVLPDANRHDFSLGVGYQFSKMFRIDFAYLFVYFVPRNAPEVFLPAFEQTPGRYTSQAHLFALNFGLTF